MTVREPPIRIVEYDFTWPDQFAREAEVLRAALGQVAVRIEHVGSTSVPGLAAKPVIDINVSVASLEPLDSYRKPLEALGYLFVFDDEMPDKHFFGKPKERPRTYHVHVCAVGSVHERSDVAFREYLRAHPAEANQYAALKRDLVARTDGERAAYMAGKDAYIKRTKARASRWVETGQAP